MIPLPSPNSDPAGLAALVGVLATAIVVALGVDGVWGPVIGAAVPLVAIVLARCKAWAPATVKAEVAQVAATTRQQTLRGHTPHGADTPTDLGPFTRPEPEGPL